MYLPFIKETLEALRALRSRTEPECDYDFCAWLDCEIAGVICEWEPSWIVRFDPWSCDADVGPVSEEVAWTLKGIAVGAEVSVAEVCEGFARQLLARAPCC